MPKPIVGVVLAGGRSSRMGGGDKSLLALGDRTILGRVLERLRPQVSDIIINANGDAARFGAFGLPVVADDIAGLAGPLAGVHAVAGDTRFFPPDLVAQFLAAPERHPSLVVAASKKGTHPVFELWPITLADKLENSLRGGMRKVGMWIREHGAIEVLFPPGRAGNRIVDPFFNINRSENLTGADALLRKDAS
jgi:molybdenum cofactor guanylyltransferase